MLRKLFLLSFLFGVAFAAKPANKYVDDVLQTSLLNELLSADLLPAARLPDFTTLLDASKDHKEIIKIDFTFGNVTGLDRIKRKGDCSGPKSYKSVVSINCTLSLLPLQSAHRMVVRNSTYSSVGKAHAALSEVLIDLKIVGRAQGSDGLLREFDVGSVDSPHPVFSNIPAYLKGDVEYLENVYKNHVLNEFHIMLSQNYADALRQAMIGVPMPRNIQPRL